MSSVRLARSRRIRARTRSTAKQVSTRLHPVLIAACLFASPGSLHGAERQIVGALATVAIDEAGIEFLGRVDTGAKTTSIHALDIVASGGRVSFRIVNDAGESRSLDAEIVKQAAVKNADASEARYFVYLTLRYRGDEKKIMVNLNDRSASTYKMLLGRNWLTGSYLVDVDR